MTTNRDARRAIQKSGQVNRSFNYSKGTEGQKGFIQLNFTLRVDVKDELNDFLELMEIAIVDIKDEIKK